MVLKKALGELYEDYNLVIAYDSGRPVEANWVRKQLKAVIQQNHLAPVVFHSLRNSSTSLKLEFSKGDIIVLQKFFIIAYFFIICSYYSCIL